MYRQYQDTIRICLSNDALFNTFKAMSNYTAITEHVSPKLGLEYLKYIGTEFYLTADEIMAYCNKNDRLGNPTIITYTNEIKCSPSSLRYIYHALLVLNHMKTLGLNNVSVVELGCAYGGLCLAVDHYSRRFGITIKHYSLIDLEEASLLEKKYLSYHTLSYPCSFHVSNNYGKDIFETNLFFISNYCFSEIGPENQKYYMEHLLPKCSHGFIAWNDVPYFDIGKHITIEEERPQTDLVTAKNRFVRF